MEREQGQGPGRWGGLMGLSRGGGEVLLSWQWEAFEDCPWGEWLQGGLYTGGPGGPDASARRPGGWAQHAFGGRAHRTWV